MIFICVCPFSNKIHKNVALLTTSKRAAMRCGWGVKAGIVLVCVRVAGKTVWSCYHGPYRSALR